MCPETEGLERLAAILDAFAKRPVESAGQSGYIKFSGNEGADRPVTVTHAGIIKRLLVGDYDGFLLCLSVRTSEMSITRVERT